MSEDNFTQSISTADRNRDYTKINGRGIDDITVTSSNEGVGLTLDQYLVEMRKKSQKNSRTVSS
jgi:hypothetical protein